MLSTQKGTIVRQRVRDIALQSRTATGVRVQRLDEGNHILSVAMLPEEPDDDEDDGANAAAGGNNADAVAAAVLAASLSSSSLGADDHAEEMTAWMKEKKF